MQFYGFTRNININNTQTKFNSLLITMIHSDVY